MGSYPTSIKHEQQLWQAVIIKVIREWACGPLRRQREAAQYLFGNDKDFPLVCQSAGIDVSRLRASLERFLRQQDSRKVL